MDILTNPFVMAALDPNVVSGIYNTCDQWCMYCPATARCLAFRCSSDAQRDNDPKDIYRDIADRMYEGLHLLRELNAAEGRTIPELEALIADDPRKITSCPAVDDPLERMGRRYATVSSRYLMSRPDFPFAMKRRANGPTPFEVFAWYHMLIAVKIYRAVLSSSKAARGEADLRIDALYAAKTALIGIDRSRAALSEMQVEDDDARLGEMQAQLRRLGRELEGRFPEARAILRPGLDPAAN